MRCAVALWLLPALSHGLSHALERVADPGTWPTSSAGNFSGYHGDWGAHRVQVSIRKRLMTVAESSTLNGSSAMVLAELQWRRRDVAPESKDVRVVFRTSDSNPPRHAEVVNRVVLALNAPYPQAG